jgi:RNA polymerase sigma-70 factor, ECF subfamily
VRDGRPRVQPSRTEQAEILDAFVRASTAGDMERLMALLDPDVVWRADGGGKVRAAPRLVHGTAADLLG